jgi:hypothetical protein
MAKRKSRKNTESFGWRSKKGIFKYGPALVALGLLASILGIATLTESLSHSEKPVPTQVAMPNNGVDSGLPLEERNKLLSEVDTTGDVWRDLRNNPGKNYRRVVTFEINVWSIGMRGEPWGRLYINPRQIDSEKNVILTNNHLTSLIHSGDNLIVQGEFDGIASSGYVILTPIKTVNLGSKEIPIGSF